MIIYDGESPLWMNGGETHLDIALHRTRKFRTSNIQNFSNLLSCEGVERFKQIEEKSAFYILYTNMIDSVYQFYNFNLTQSIRPLL